MDLQQAFDEGFEAVKNYVDATCARLERRLAELESRPGVPGEKGDPGPPGPPGNDGRDGKDGKDGAPGKDGASVTPGDVIPLIDEAVAHAMASIPPAKDGKDGLDGKDGAPGKDGRDGLPGQPGRDGKDGAPGKDGVDGFGFDDLTLDYDGERTLVLRFVHGERKKEFQITIPVTIDRGVWRQGEYAKADGVTYGGSFWIAQKNTAARPGDNDDWRLAVKRGRDGRDAAAKAAPPQKPIALK